MKTYMTTATASC